MDIAVLTHFPSPYQVELFNAIAAREGVDIEVFYLHRSHHERQWSGQDLQHAAVFLQDGQDQLQKAMRHFSSAGLAVLNYYNEPTARKLMGLRSASGLPWVFWGERPRTHRYYSVSRIFRRVRLRMLHRSRAPIWGIGKLAVQAYREEFGPARSYNNIPYFSDLGRFDTPPLIGGTDGRGERTFLYSGSLIPRKGVDFLARAFRRLSREGLRVGLNVMGAGPLEGSMRAELRDCLDRVKFLGFQDWHALPSAYAAADFLCVPSRYDGWGMVVPEGLAAGLPVIGTVQTGAAMEFITPHKNGWLIPEDNEDALFEAMREAASLSPAERGNMSSAARESVSEHTLENGAQRLIQAAEHAIEEWNSEPIRTA